MKTILALLFLLALFIIAILSTFAAEGWSRVTAITNKGPALITRGVSNLFDVTTSLTTNWLGLSLAVPNGDGTTRSATREVGIITSNRHAIFVVDGKTNRVLVSSEILTPLQRSQDWIILSNTNLPTSAYPRVWRITNSNGSIYELPTQ